MRFWRLNVVRYGTIWKNVRDLRRDLVLVLEIFLLVNGINGILNALCR
jgi:hypothetical protein